MTNKDYEKAKQECWKEYWSSAKCQFKGDAAKYVCEDAFGFAFNRAYQLGKEHAEADRDAEILKTHLQVEHYLGEKRIQLAGMAMQGFVANGKMNSEEYIAKKSVAIADALLNELNKENNE